MRDDCKTVIFVQTLNYFSEIVSDIYHKLAENVIVYIEGLGVSARIWLARVIFRFEILARAQAVLNSKSAFLI